MSPGGLIERRDAHQTMHAGFGRQQSVRIFAFDFESHALDARLLGGLIVDNLRFETAPLRPLQIHAQEHLSPILRFGPASAWMNRANGVAQIVLACQKRFGLDLADFMIETTEHLAQLIDLGFV